MPSLNSLIGLAFIVAAPFLAIWTLISARFWRLTRTRGFWLRSYRFDVTIFLLALTINVLDFIRLRYRVWVGPLAPESVSWLVFALRWWLALSIILGTVVLYGKEIAGWVRPTRARADPYLDDPPDLTDIQAQSARVTALTLRLRRIATELNEIVERVERDKPIFLPNDGEHQ